MTGSKFIPITISILIIFITFLIPIKILKSGFFPTDDALHHAAKVISGKNWDEILIIRQDMKMDSHPGWQSVLKIIYKISRWDARKLVLFSVISLFLLFSLVPIAFLRRPEAWPLTLLILSLANMSVIYRLLLGRPYIVTMSFIIALGFLWPKLKEKKMSYAALIAIAFGATIVTWVHSCWYLIIPLVCFFMAKEYRAGLRAAAAMIIGVFTGVLLTGHPISFLQQTLWHIFLSLSTHGLRCTVVPELQPFNGEFFTLVIIFLMLLWRGQRNTKSPNIFNDPIFLIVALSWMMGFIARRMWFDCGIPALAFWMSKEFQEFFEDRMRRISWRYFLFTTAVILTFYIAVTGDPDGRWSKNKPEDYLPLSNSSEASWLPESGGIIYSHDMYVFYSTFFENPNAPWRYMLGFEPSVMPPADFAIYKNIKLNNRSFLSFAPWVRKMRPQDRLVLTHRDNVPPNTLGLEWYNAKPGIWIGRLPRKS